MYGFEKKKRTVIDKMAMGKEYPKIKKEQAIGFYAEKAGRRCESAKRTCV
ncbi:hypothetical protein [Lysinibacillus sp. NPDC092081]